jgi:hypothetical protein
VPYPHADRPRAFGRLRAACVRYCADLGCRRITLGFIQNAPRDSIPSRSVSGSSGIRRGMSVRTASGRCCLEKEV